MKLLQPVTLGPLHLRNRTAMAPMTRSRADHQGVVGDMTVTYYRQRASAGLIISEGINISEQAIGNPLTPGLYTDAQVAAWKKVTEAVHAEGGTIFAQLWHTGRVGHSLNRNGVLPVAPSAIAIQGQQVFTAQGPKDYEVPRALETEEIPGIVADYRRAAENAKLAGFDGVELHGAFGYLPNQFLLDGVNHRTDAYGGSIENRSRFTLEVMRALVDVWGEGRAAIKLSPSNPYNNMLDSDPTAVFSYLIAELNKLPLAYLQLMRPLFPLDAFPHYPKDVHATFAHLFDKPLMLNGGYQPDAAEAEVQAGKADLVSFGNLYLANPDLPARIAQDGPYNAADPGTMFGGGAQGYIDYPTLS